MQERVIAMGKMKTAGCTASLSRFNTGGFNPRHFKSKATASLGALLVMLLAMLTFPVAAAHVEVQGGRSYMDNDGATTVFVEGVFAKRHIGNSSFTWSPDVSMGWINGRDISRFRNTRYDTRRSVALVAAGARFHYGAEGDWYQPLFFSFQPALVTRRTQALSTPYEFVSTLGWQGRRFSFQIRHISNGDLHRPNRGETMALVGVGFDL